ncbi:hypothetical protein AB0M02_41995 [Actinoplanes sp. NPDC051861]|uniref:hypothetical protein n=1 Tax=Actinoplanes sp. NPDC051861 TaxID=3155170 RepID=UPI00341CE8FC
MTVLWPYIPEAVAVALYAEVADGKQMVPASAHESQLWAPVGARISTRQVTDLVTTMVGVAERFGFPTPAPAERRIAFDREAAFLIRAGMDLTWSEAGNRGIWSFMSLVALPHLTEWRFGTDNNERWIATDLTRHTWARLWWQAVVFEGRESLLAALSESDLNQLLERRSIGGDRRLVAAMASAIIDVPADLSRRLLIRDVSRRLRRYLAFVDVKALDDSQVDMLCRKLCTDSVRLLRPEDGPVVGFSPSG